MIKVHITDDHAMMVELLIPVIDASSFAEVTGSSGSLAQCQELLDIECPDVLLLDINLTDGNGIDFCAKIHKQYPKLKIIALTGRSEYSCVVNMLKNGASGYVVKGEAVSEVLEAIQAVMHEKEYICKEMEQIIRKTTKKAITLSPREMEVLQMIAKGMSSSQIADKMEIATSTVNSFQKKLHLKLDATNKIELVDNARKEGLIE